MLRLLLTPWLICLTAFPLMAEELPHFSDHAFADQVISFTVGSPAATQKPDNRPAWVLGKPSRKHPALTLGCGGVLVVRFVDNALIDVAGDDLYVFEIGPDVEATQVEISADHQHWINVGVVAGATSSLNIHPYSQPGETFSDVRLTDLRQSCDSTTPGADIDAIAAIGSATRYRFDAAVLFDFDKAVLKDTARELLQQWAPRLSACSGQLQIIGHTDQQGTEAYNMRLSKQRAQAVATYLHTLLPATQNISSQGMGEKQPLSQDTSEQAAAQNRRVEIVCFPPQPH